MMIKRLEFRKMGFGFDGGTEVFNEVDFELPLGENVLVTGVSGTGRSTILKILAALLIPTRGSYFLNEFDVTQMSFEEFLPFRRKIGVSFDFGGLLANRTLKENLMLPLLYHDAMAYEEAEKLVVDYMTRFGLMGHADTRPASVSGGMRKACVVARSFVMQPEMLIMDDPFVALDAQSMRATQEILNEQRKQGTLKHVFFTTREEHLADRLATRAITIDGGRLRFAPSSQTGVGKAANQ